MKNNKNLTTYKGKIRKGGLGDFEAEWWTEKDWERHEALVKKLKESGEFGKEVDIKCTVVHNPTFDDKNPSSRPMLSSRLIFLDTSEFDEE